METAGYTFADMKRGLVRGWGDLGARTADCWRDYNRRFFGGELEPMPMFFIPVAPYGKCIAWTCTAHPVTHIALCRPKTRNPGWTADRNTLLHEMIHAWLDQQGLDPHHDGTPWCKEIMRLHRAITGKEIFAGRSKVTKVKTADGTRKSVRVQEKGSLGQAEIARWPRSCGIKLGEF